MTTKTFSMGVAFFVFSLFVVGWGSGLANWVDVFFTVSYELY